MMQWFELPLVFHDTVYEMVTFVLFLREFLYVFHLIGIPNHTKVLL